MEIKKEEKRAVYGIRISLTEQDRELGHAYLYIMQNDLHPEPFGFMEDVFVEKEFRGQGLGNKLMAALIAEAKERGCYKLIGTARHAKKDVRDWYQKLGFEDFGSELRMNL